MAGITSSGGETIFQLQKFLGINESPDGDTQLKMGESPLMRNWQVTAQNHLRVRAGFGTLERFDGPLRGLWSGYVAGQRKTVCAAAGGVWEVEGETVRRIGDIWDAPTTMFGFDDKVYLLNGHEYLVWDGEGYVDTVDGYVPLISTAIAPSGGGTTVENVNRLTGKRRCEFSADGKATEFRLPEKGLLLVEKITIGTDTPVTGWTVDKAEGVITFAKAPEAGNSNVKVWYTMPNTLRALVEGMRYSEQFNGAADTRVFLYGDGSAKAIYCGVTEDGKASAEYFPDLYEMQVGSSNAPLTGMIKYYDRLMSYKADGGAYSTSYEVTSMPDGSVVPGFRTVSVNKEIGNEAAGQVRLVDNIPRTLYQGNLYGWAYINYAQRDERNAKLLSGKVQKSLSAVDPAKVYCFDDDTKREYYIFLNDEAGTALINNYQADVWYLYTGLPATCAARVGQELLLGLSDGRLVRMSEGYLNDDKVPIDAYWESGSLSFEKDYRRKSSGEIWVSMQPTSNANLLVTARSDRRSGYLDKAVNMVLATFRGLNFGSMSFLTNRTPQMERIKLKVKKFAYYQLILKSNFAASDATVLGVDFAVRYTGNVK